MCVVSFALWRFQASVRHDAAARWNGREKTPCIGVGIWYMEKKHLKMSDKCEVVRRKRLYFLTVSCVIMYNYVIFNTLTTKIPVVPLRNGIYGLNMDGKALYGKSLHLDGRPYYVLWRMAQRETLASFSAGYDVNLGRRYSERPPFIFRKATFCTVKGRVLEAKTRPFANPLTVRRLQGGWTMASSRGLYEDLPQAFKAIV